MAIEDEIINISDIDIGTEVLKSDKLLIETSNGTKLIAFKDFVVGPDNISSVRQNQIEGNAVGERDTFYSTVTGFNILTSDTTPGLNTKYDEISGTIELGKFNFNAIANLASVSADIATNTAVIDDLRKDINTLGSTLNDTGNTVLQSITLSNSACNFHVTGAGSDFRKFGTYELTFKTAELDPSTTNPNAALSLSPFKVTFPGDGEGFEDSYFLLDGSFTVLLGPFSRASRKNNTGTMTIHLDSPDGSTQVVHQQVGSTYADSGRNRLSDNAFQRVVRIKQGQSLRVTAGANVRSGSLLGFKL